MAAELFKRTAVGALNPPSRLRDTHSDPFHFAAVVLSVFGIHIGDPSQQSNSIVVRVIKILASAITVIMANVYFLQHLVSYLNGLSSWVHTKWLAASLASAVTAAVVVARGARIKHVASFYRTNFLPWRSRAKTVAKVKSTAIILVVWTFVLTNCVDSAINATRESEKVYSYMAGPPENGTFVASSSPFMQVFLRLDEIVRWFFILGPTCFSIFLYTFMTELAAGNMNHLKSYMLTLKHSDHEDPAEVIRQIRDLYFHQATSAQDVDSIFSGLVLLWYLMCTTFTFANIKGFLLGDFPPATPGRTFLAVLLEAFPLYCVFVGITLAAADFHDSTLHVLTQFESLMAILGKRYQLQFPSFFLAHMCMSSIGLNPPKLTVCRLFAISRLMLAVLVVFFTVVVVVVLQMSTKEPPIV